MAVTFPPLAVAESASAPPTPTISTPLDRSAAIPCAPPLMLCRSTVSPFFAKMPASMAVQTGRLSPVRFVYATLTAIGATGVADAAVEAPTLGDGDVGAVAPPQATPRTSASAMKLPRLRMLTS